jgi:hypothetical protein
VSAELYARALLNDVGSQVDAVEIPGAPCAAAEWARSGALALTGNSTGPPVLPRAPLPSCARGAALALDALAPGARFDALDAPALLGERAAFAGLTRNGRISPGGACRLLPGKDGWLALGLPRGNEDLRLLPAWLGIDGNADPWPLIERALAQLPVAEAVERGRWLGLPVAQSSPDPVAPELPWLSVSQEGAAASRGARPRRVADLTTLWAGPLCGQLLAHAGHAVTKVESVTRPDGARFGSPQLFELLNGSKSQRAFEFATERGRAALREYLSGVDVVLESARPRALRQLGVVAEEWLAEAPGRVWCSITGYGRAGPSANWVALGDDAAAAAGLPFRVAAADRPLFVGDAIADPLTGLQAAVAVLASLVRGGGELLDVSLVGVVARGMAHDALIEGNVVENDEGWFVETDASLEPVRPPRARLYSPMT